MVSGMKLIVNMLKDACLIVKRLKGTNFEKFRYMYFSIVSLQDPAPFYPFLGRKKFVHAKENVELKNIQIYCAFIYHPLLCVGSLISIIILLLPQMSRLLASD